MDIEKLVKDGARAIWSVSYDHDYESVPFDEAWSRARYTHLRQRLEQQSRAVLAIALKAAAEEADDRAQTYADLANRHDGTPMGSSYTDRCGACASVASRLRALAAQLGGSDDARCR